jgi:hypothetical protein
MPKFLLFATFQNFYKIPNSRRTNIIPYLGEDVKFATNQQVRPFTTDSNKFKTYTFPLWWLSMARQTPKIKNLTNHRMVISLGRYCCTERALGREALAVEVASVPLGSGGWYLIAECMAFAGARLWCGHILWLIDTWVDN